MRIIGVKTEGRKGDQSDFVEFRLCEVNYIDLWNPTKHSGQVPVYHTAKGSFSALQTLKDIAAAYHEFGFSSYDRSTIINKKRILHEQPKKYGLIVTFKDGSEVIVTKK